MHISYVQDHLDSYKLFERNKIFRAKMSKRSLVINLYKNLLHMGKDYPQGFDYFRSQLKNVFLKNRHVTNPEEVDQLIKKGEYVMKELEALYMLKKYRTLKKRYEK